MAYSPPSGHTFTTNEQVTAATLNTYMQGNVAFLYGDSAWIGATNQHSWVPVGAGFATPAYRLQGTTVLLRGRIQSGTMNQTCFTLPVGYRPTNGALLFPCVSNLAFGMFQVDTAGGVTPVVGTNVDFSINCQFDVLA